MEILKKIYRFIASMKFAILLLILVLLLMDGETDNGTLLLTVALYFLLQ